MEKYYTAAERLTQEFAAAAKKHSTMERSIKFYADLLHITPDHLSRCIRICTGKTATIYITDMVLQEAKLLLDQTAFTISEIAYRVGFEDNSYFTRLFKKNTGATPKEYRERCAN